MGGKKGKKGSKFLFIYLVIAFAFGLVGLTDSLLGLFEVGAGAVYSWLILVLATGFFFFNIYALVKFMQEKLSRITWVLPIYHLVSFVVFFGLGIGLGILGLFLKEVVSFLGWVGVVTSLFEVGFVLYLLKKFKFF